MVGTVPINETKSMAAWMGSALHDRIAVGIQSIDPFQERFLVERRVEFEGLSGTVDCYDKELGRVIDWKTSKKSSLGMKVDGSLGASADRWPSQQNRWQVHLYGYMLTQEGFDVREVSLVGIARDGDEGTLREFVEPYEEVFAKEALAYIKEVSEATDPPAPEPSGLCKSYCKFWDSEGTLCPSGIS
jgi:hypothetical protein